MIKKIILSLLLAVNLIAKVEAQKTTNVKGYYRKDGTHVKPHVRRYKSAKNYSNNSYTTKSGEDELIPISSLTPMNFQNEDYVTLPGFEAISPTTLTPITEVVPDTDTIQPNTNEGIIIYVSILRYNGKTIDICPIRRDIFLNWDFKSVSHQFSKNVISMEDALDLVGKFNWKIDGDMISKLYFSTEEKLPKYLTKTIEAIKLK